jgi:murein DD-endopeptidase MepM/ murein hydrolase activator NlpD
MYKTLFISKTNGKGGIMKKIILILLLFSALFAASCKLSLSNIDRIEAVNTVTNESTLIEKDSVDAKSIMDALNKAEKTEKDTTGYFPFEINLISGSDKDVHTLYFDMKNQAAYVTKNDELYKIRDKEAHLLFLNEIFSYIYVDNTIYDSHVVLNGENVTPDIKYDWTYKNIEGRFVKKQGILKTSQINGGKLLIHDADLIEFKYETNPDSQVIRLFSEGNLVAAGSSVEEVLQKAASDGEYYIECQAQWFMKQNSDFYGSSTSSFTATVDKNVDVSIVTRENYPGNILIVQVNNLNADETVSIQTDAVKVDIKNYLYKDKNVYISPIDLNTAAGEYKLSAKVMKDKAVEYEIEKTLIVKEKSFKTQYLTVDENLNQSNNDSAAILEFAELVKPARTVSSDKKLWEGTFAMPVEGELTTDFAEIRYVNNEKSSSRHSGLDIAAPKGTEVSAPNNGIVTFAMEGLLSPGNTVVIDHGMGLFTSYYHLDTIDVLKGQEVKKGDVIGTVGTTGFSTGPHLHYAVSIYNSYVNPYQTLSGIID